MDFLKLLQEHGELNTVREATRLSDLSERLQDGTKATLFTNVGAGGDTVAGNLLSSRRRVALALDTTPDGVLAAVLKRLEHPLPGIEIDGPAPVQERVVVGTEVDLTSLPIHLQHETDAAPYISSAIDVTIDPGSGRSNTGCRRLMIRGRNRLGIDLTAPSDLRASYQKARRQGRALPIAFVLGGWPTDLIAAALPALSLRSAVDEIALLGALRETPVPLVRGVTVPISVPSDADYVIEGEILPDADAPEGPYGEYLGYDGEVKHNPVVRVTAITHRVNATWPAVTIGTRAVAQTDTAQLCAIATELRAWQALQEVVRNPVAVCATPSSGGMFNVRVSIGSSRPGAAKSVIATLLASAGNIKNVFVVDPDIDVFNDSEMDWALASRFDPDHDLVVLRGMRPVALDPSQKKGATASKVGFDLTLDAQTRSRTPVSVPVKEWCPGNQNVIPADEIRNVLSAGPQAFSDLLRLLRPADELVLVRALEDALASLDSSGRYAL